MTRRRALVKASEDAIVVRITGGRRREFAIGEETRIVRALRRSEADDLQAGDKVLVVARDGGREASTILAFPAHEEPKD